MQFNGHAAAAHRYLVRDEQADDHANSGGDVGEGQLVILDPASCVCIYAYRMIKYRRLQSATAGHYYVER